MLPRAPSKRLSFRHIKFSPKTLRGVIGKKWQHTLNYISNLLNSCNNNSHIYEGFKKLDAILKRRCEVFQLLGHVYFATGSAVTCMRKSPAKLESGRGTELSACWCRLGISSRRQINVRRIKLWNPVGRTRFPSEMSAACRADEFWRCSLYSRSRTAHITNTNLSRERNVFLPTCGLLHTTNFQRFRNINIHEVASISQA
jgi:hypothetical protein